MTSFSFYFHPSGKPAPIGIRDAFILRRDDDWNDFSNRVRFSLQHVDAAGQQTRVGKVKILRMRPNETQKFVEKITELPDRFGHLEQGSFISLGQTRHYFKMLASLLGPKNASSFLEAMCDIAALPALAEAFETSSVFRNGLLRENEAELARRYGLAWLKGEEVPVSSAFDYSVTIGRGEVPTNVRFSFDEDDIVPGRIVCIVGRNAVGKTGFMAELARDLAHLGYHSLERQKREALRFPAGRPLFPRVLAISYSAFDRFERPKVDASSTYIYCGIRNEKGSFSSRSLSQAFARNKVRIRDLRLVEEWIIHVQTILGEEGLSEKELRAEVEEDLQSDAGSPFDRLSSGQAILCHFVTGLLAWIQPASLILFDEPETHLHPNAVASLFLVLTQILKKNHSYAVVATHSPIVLQEVPVKRVVHFVRRGATTTNEPLGMESFGESLTELTRHVFNTIEVENSYKLTLRRLARTEGSPTAVLQHFPEGLGLAAEAYLLAQFDQDGQPK